MVPPACSFNDGGANWLGDGAVNVIDDRLYWYLFVRGRGVFLGKAEMRDVALDDGLIDGCGEIHVGDAEKTGAWIVRALAETCWRRLDEGEMLVDGDGVRVGCDLLDPAARIVSD